MSSSQGPSGAPSTRKQAWSSRGPRRSAGGQTHPWKPTSKREEDEPSSSGWKLPEDLGAKKMEAPRGVGTEKLSVSVRPLWKRWATAPNPPQKNTWTRRSHFAP